MGNKKYYMVRSETWLKGDIEQIGSILQEAIEQHIPDSDEIINIEKHTEDDGLSRFWIYVKYN